MNIKRILSTVMAFSIISTVTPVFADEGDYTEFGTPFYDATDGEYTSDLVEGHVIAIPIDVTSTTSGVTSWAVGFQVIDTDLLSFGVVDDDLTDDEYDNLASLGDFVTSSSVDYAIDALGSWNTRGTQFTTKGAMVVNPGKFLTSGGDYINFMEWYLTDTTATTTSLMDGAEAYAIFEVLKDSSVDETDELNADLLKLYHEYFRLSDTGNGKGALEYIDGESARANACESAFKLTIDGSQLDYYISSLTANIYTDSEKGTLITSLSLNTYTDELNGTEADSYVDGSYTFPARIVIDDDSSYSSLDSVYVEIVATTADSASKTLAGATFALDSSVTSYDEITAAE